MKSDDIEPVGEIWLRASLRAHDFVPAAFWRADHAVMVGEILPKAAGFVHVTESVIDGFITGRGGVVDCLFVAPERQGQGIGRLLLDHAKRRNTALRLTVYEQNVVARRFYEKQGFRPVGVSKCRHTGCPEVVMEWNAAA